MKIILTLAFFCMAIELLMFHEVHAEPDIGLVDDPAIKEVTGEFKKGSHVKIFLPYLPHIAIAPAINAGLIRPANNNLKGWQYDVAISHKNFNDKIWEFKLREGVSFQDGSPFNADSVILNMAYFKKKPFVFTKFHIYYKKVEKIDDYTVRFYMTKPYAMFLYDAIFLQFYTPDYLKKHGWNGKATGPNLSEPGPYGLGPYILHEGYIQGDRSTPKVVLKANPLYWGKNKPKVETITVFSELSLSEATELALKSEGGIDITPVPFADQMETVLSPFAKLTVSPSMNSYAMHFNMINGSPAMSSESIRYVVNHAIDKEYLLNLSMLGEGMLSPTMVSPNVFRLQEAINLMDDFFTQYSQTHSNSTDSLRQMVRDYQKQQGLPSETPLQLTLYAQESFIFLIKDIKYFLAQVNIDLKTEIVASEKYVFEQLNNTWQNANSHHWDLLLWGNYDWYKHPWSAFFVYNSFSAWSTIPYNKALNDLTDRLTYTNIDSDQYITLLVDLMTHVYEHNYMVFLPTPNKLFAINKEVIFNAGNSAFVFLRDLEVTDLHWSVRGDKEYPEVRKKPLKINRQKLQQAEL